MGFALMHSQTNGGANDLLVDVLASVSKLTHGSCNHLEELVLPYSVQLVHLLVPVHAVRS
jgi:hypothetical protein